jgi:hypothetical protein
VAQRHSLHQSHSPTSQNSEKAPNAVALSSDAAIDPSMRGLPDDFTVTEVEINEKLIRNWFNCRNVPLA